MKRFPRRGHEAEEVWQAMDDVGGSDAQWKDGRVWSLVFHPGDELSDFAKQAYLKYFSENALNPSAFPSLKRMETEVVSMTADLLGGDDEVAGNMTSGGTESILMAVKTAREWAAVHKPKVSRPEMVLPRSAHPAFEKAAHYFGVKSVHVPLDSSFRADIKQTAKAINDRTIMLVGSAPAYPQGVVDPISKLAHLAVKRDILCHVDACVGGFMLPFVRDLDYHVPDFDFQVPGVTSMSVDLHKYGYTAKGASVILYRDAELRKHQYFAYTNWPGGIYASPTMTGTRPGGAIAAAWAMLHRLGFDGYRRIAEQVMETTQRLRRGIESVEGMDILGEPHMSIMAIGSKTHDVYEVGDQMTTRGWHLDRQQFPPSLHLTINFGHLDSADNFVTDLRQSARLTEKEPMERLIDRTKYVLLGAAARVLPKRIVSRVTNFASTKLGLGEGDLPEQTAAMYGMMASLPNRGDLETVVIDALDGMTRYDAKQGEILPSPEEPEPPEEEEELDEEPDESELAEEEDSEPSIAEEEEDTREVDSE